APEAPLPAAIMADEQPSEPVAAHIETKKAEPQKRVKKSKIKTGPLSMFRFGLLSKDKAQLPFTIILFAGLAIYAVTLILSSATLSTVGAWGMTIVAGTMMVVGFSRTMMVWDAPDEAVVPSSESTEDEEIIEMCPDCHEKVDPTDEKCPACGTEFEPSENR
ncbi:MAG TPA: hypothetical protein VLH13_01805, partial [Methanomassiliicoccales archaeon]|nr:hypothetical protein [Methanomassiliicoccales archaeon]